MTTTPENDRDGVDRPESDEVHENTRSSAEGVEEPAISTEGDAAAGLIGGGASGKGEMTDPRYIATR